MNLLKLRVEQRYSRTFLSQSTLTLRVIFISGVEAFCLDGCDEHFLAGYICFVLIASAHGHFREETTYPTYTSRNLHGGVSASVTAAGQVEIGGTDRTEEPSGFIDKTLIRRQIETRPFQANRTGSGQTKTDSEINYDLVSRKYAIGLLLLSFPLEN